MSKLFLTALLALAVAASAAAVADVAPVEEEAQLEMPTALRSSKHYPKCYLAYKKCCDVYKSNTCYKDECYKKKYCYEVHKPYPSHGNKYSSYDKKHYRAAVENSAVEEAGEVDSSIKKYKYGGHHGYHRPKPEYKCDYKDECKKVPYECGKYEHECSEGKKKECGHGECDHY